MSIIGWDTEMTGDLFAQENVDIQGSFYGQIKCRNQITISEGGFVRAEVDTSRMVIWGDYQGDVKASRQLEILKGAKFRGKMIIQPEVLVLSRKADFAEKDEEFEPGSQ